MESCEHLSPSSKSVSGTISGRYDSSKADSRVRGRSSASWVESPFKAPEIPVSSQDHRHGFRIDRLDDRVRRCRQDK
jgi:hypothetical protein